VTGPRYALKFEPLASRQIRKLDRAVAARIRAATEKLRDNPRPAGCVPVVGSAGCLRIRVGDYRVIYTVVDAQLVVFVIEVGHRREVYR